MAHARDAIAPSASVRTPETYLGTYRAAAYTQHLHPGADWNYGAAAGTATNTVALSGHWKVESHQIVAGAGARLLFDYIAPRIYLVAAPPAAGAVTLGVTVDGRRKASVRVPADDLYQLAHMPTPGPHLLALSVPAGTTLYSFTFG
jgi:Thioredoxin like C-terminal domain